MSVKLLSYAEYIHRICAKQKLDHSAIYSVSRWIEGCLEEKSPGFERTQMHARALSDTITLTGGLGMTEIWSLLATNLLDSTVTSRIEMLDAAAQALPQKLVGEISHTYSYLMELNAQRRLKKPNL
jgi:midasin